MEALSQFSENYRSSLNSLKLLIVIVLVINLLFALQFYYHDSMIAYVFFNFMLLITVCVFLIIKIVLYFKDRKREKINKFGPNSPEAKSLMYAVTEEMKGWVYYFNPHNINYLIEFYIGSHVIGIILRWCSSLGFVVVWINGYFIKKVLKDVYGMTLKDLRDKVVGYIKKLEYLIPRYQIKDTTKVE